MKVEYLNILYVKAKLARL